MPISAASASPDLLGIAAIITAAGGLVGGIAALVAAARRDRPKPPAADDDDRHRTWQELYEQLDAANEEVDRLRKELADCNRERLSLFRRQARRPA